jgi:hypothetical protein
MHHWFVQWISLTWMNSVAEKGNSLIHKVENIDGKEFQMCVSLTCAFPVDNSIDWYSSVIIWCLIWHVCSRSLPLSYFHPLNLSNNTRLRQFMFRRSQSTADKDERHSRGQPDIDLFCFLCDHTVHLSCCTKLHHALTSLIVVVV